MQPNIEMLASFNIIIVPRAHNLARRTHKGTIISLNINDCIIYALCFNLRINHSIVYHLFHIHSHETNSKPNPMKRHHNEISNEIQVQVNQYDIQERMTR
jgi:hypothetical protein